MECRFCGKPTTLLVGGAPICEDCCQNAGSCCREFGGDDLWQQRNDEESEHGPTGVEKPGGQTVTGKPSSRTAEFRPGAGRRSET